MIVFVGEAPGPSGKTGFDGWSGQRLARLLDVEMEVLASKSKFVNVFAKYPGPAKYKHHEEGGKGSSFPMKEARKRWPRVRRLVASLSPRLVVFLGKRVARLVSVDDRPFLTTWLETEFGAACAIIPHPSGVNRWYLAAENVVLFRSSFVGVVHSTLGL